MSMPIGLGVAYVADQIRRWKLEAAKGLTNDEKQQAILAKRPILPLRSPSSMTPPEAGRGEVVKSGGLSRPSCV